MKLRKLPKCPKCGHELNILFVKDITFNAIGIDDGGHLIYKADLSSGDCFDYSARISCEHCGYEIEDKYAFDEISDLPDEIKIDDEYTEVDVDENLIG